MTGRKRRTRPSVILSYLKHPASITNNSDHWWKKGCLSNTCIHFDDVTTGPLENLIKCTCSVTQQKQL